MYIQIQGVLFEKITFNNLKGAQLKVYFKKVKLLEYDKR